MSFGERLFKLRKEKGWSQAELAEKVDTTRQAISKWENNQGYPETEKLLMLSNIFEVSVDSLLKENVQNVVASEKGYYVSRECAEGFLQYERKVSKGIGLGLATLIAAGMSFFIFENHSILANVVACLVAAISVGILISTSSIENRYKRLKWEHLLFDPHYYAELEERATAQRKQNKVLLIMGSGLIFVGAALDFLNESMAMTALPLEELMCASVAVAVYCFVYVVGIDDAFYILLKSEERMEKLYIRMWKKLRDKIA